MIPKKMMIALTLFGITSFFAIELNAQTITKHGNHNGCALRAISDAELTEKNLCRKFDQFNDADTFIDKSDVKTKEGNDLIFGESKSQYNNNPHNNNISEYAQKIGNKFDLIYDFMFLNDDKSPNAYATTQRFNLEEEKIVEFYGRDSLFLPLPAPNSEMGKLHKDMNEWVKKIQSYHLTLKQKSLKSG